MSWLSNIFGGGVTAVSKGVERIGGVFTENREARGQRHHEANMATMGQFAAEFVARKHRSHWDSFVDGLNRLPRPLITLSVLGLFVYAPYDPEKFALVASAYGLIPAGFWGLLSVIIAFYFGGRLSLHRQDFEVSKASIAAAKELSAMQRSIDEDETSEENRVVKAWLKRPA